MKGFGRYQALARGDNMQKELNADIEKAVQILDYWLTLEFLNQQNLGNFKDKEDKVLKYKKALKGGSVKPKKIVEDFVQFKSEDNLQTITKADSEEMRLSVWSDFTVFLGCMKKELCIRKISQNVEWTGQSPDENHDEIALASLNFSKNGSYISCSLSISPLAWAMKKLSGGTVNVSQKLSISEYKSEIRTIEKQIVSLFEKIEADAPTSETKDSFPVSNVVSYQLLKKIENMILEKLEIEVADIESFIAVYFKLYASDNDAEEDDGRVGLHMDYYSEDLAFATDGLRNHRFSKEKEKLLIDYILGPNRYDSPKEKPSNRFDVVKPKNKEALFQFMLENLTAAKAPLGKWPSRFMPALMQQIAINLAIAPNSDLPVSSVNGPPGTGKTTLLKEIIVSNIVEKAILLSEYNDPDDAFDDFSFSHGEGPENSYNQYVKRYHRLKNKKINAYSILVVSSNNTAVENITKELPIEERILGDIKPSEKMDGPNYAALAELTELFTVSKSSGTLPIKRKIRENSTDKKGAGKKHSIEDVENQPDIYFSRLATDLLNAEPGNQEEQQAFGLISASLGKKSNIDKVEAKVIAPLLEIIKKNDGIADRKNNYLFARKLFLSQLALVQDLCVKLDEFFDGEKAISEACRAVEKTRRQTEAQQKAHTSQLSELNTAIRCQQNSIDRLNAEKDTLETRIAAVHAICAELEENIKEQRNNIVAGQARIDGLNKSVSKLGKYLKTAKYKNVQDSIAQELEIQEQYQQQLAALDERLSKEKQQEASIQDEINKLLSKINDACRNLTELLIRRENIEAERQRIERELNAAGRQVEEQKNLLERTKENYQNQDSYERGSVLDLQFVEDVLSSDEERSTKAQLGNPWISEHYNREREKLFLYALQMTKEFILGSKKCRDNFKHLDCLWSGGYNKGERIKFIDDDLSKCTAAAYETLFLLIPVVSSTFASVQRLLKNVTEEDIIGTLIVDEAGQASPHFAIGALCRSRKAVIVGDPNQVEPVVTDDQDLLKQTYTDDIYKPYKDKTNSVQYFADIMNPYGTYLKNAQGDDKWVGCPLLVHRRCISPMYEISNDISYNNIMKKQTAPPNAEKQKKFIFEKSQWFNVSGKEEGIKKHFVKEQGEKVVQMLEIAFSKNSAPDIFIISPFTTVISGIKDYLKKYAEECKKNGVDSYLKEYESSLPGWIEKNIGTVHKFQGREAAEVIFLLGCDASEDAKPAIQWVNNNIVNVAATRAKYRFYVIGDIEAWKKSKCVNRAKKILDSYASGNLDYARKNQKPDGKYTLVITEKPSVAETYAKALCVWNEPTPLDYYEGNGYLISWCLGHLIELAAPEQYNPKYKKWNIDDLPIIPEVWKYQIMDSKNPDEKKRILQRFDSLKTLMNRDDVTDIICATDAGREGELIFRLVYQQAECKKPFKRIWLSSMEASSIIKAFENPEPSSKYDSLYESARCRQLADWIVGMNATRYFTCLNKNVGKTFRVGRVVSPTLAMIVEREKEIEAFVPESYYIVNLNIGGTTFESRRIENEYEAIQVEQKCRNAMSDRK